MDKLTCKIVEMESELRHFAFKLTADQDSANDLVQECMLKALDNKEKFVHAQNFKGWMYTIMRNLFINNYRRATREMSMIDDNYTISQQSMIEAEDADRFEYAYDLKELHKVINAVPESMRRPFLMVDNTRMASASTSGLTDRTIVGVLIDPSFSTTKPAITRPWILS